MEYYVFQTTTEAEACINYINNCGVFPIIGLCNGIPKEDACKTEKWCETYVTLTTGEYAVPRVPLTTLVCLNIDTETKEDFKNTYGTDIRDLNDTDIQQEEIE